MQTLEDTYVPKMIDQDTRAAYEATIQPAFYEGRNEEGHFVLTGSIYYSNAIFDARFAVYPTGMIEMIGDQPILADLPVKIHAPVA